MTYPGGGYVIAAIDSNLVNRGVADVALQQRLGLLSHRRVEYRLADCLDLVPRRPYLIIMEG